MARGKAQRLYDKRRLSRHKRGYTNKWDEARKEYLKVNTTCKCGQPATDVDHIIPFRKGGKPNWRLFWDKNNWQAMCHPCHSQKTRMEADSRKGCDANGIPRDPNSHWNR